jgi:hypothetical protein
MWREPAGCRSRSAGPVRKGLAGNDDDVRDEVREMEAADLFDERRARFLKYRGPVVAARQRIRGDITARLGELKEAQDELCEAASVYRALPEERKGWVLAFVGAISVTAVALEWYPARLAALTFQSSRWTEIVALTAALALLGAALGDFAGELLRGYRDPAARRPWVHSLFLSLVVVLALAYLWAGYEMRLAYAVDVGVDYGVPRAAMAFGLVVLAALGMVFATIAVYHAESYEAFALRCVTRQLARKVRQLRWEIRHLERTYAHMDHEYRITAAPMTVAAAQEPNHPILTADQVAAFLRGDGIDGNGQVNPGVDGRIHKPPAS